MMGYKQRSRCIFFMVVILLAFVLKMTMARGRRGGGGSRFGGSGSRIKSGGGFTINTDDDSDSYSYDYRICENNNINVDENMAVYGKFYCPMVNQSYDYNYCCGESGNQRCCRFSDDPGRVAGVFAGIGLSIVVSAVWFGCCLCRRKICGRKKSDGSVNPPNELAVTPAAPPYATYPNGYSQAGVYPHQGALVYSTPQAYDQSNGFHNSPNPTGNQPQEIPYSPNPAPCVEPSVPNKGCSDPKSTDQNVTSRY